MLKLALITLMTCPVLLKIAARRDPIGVINVKELAFFALLALVAHPMNANRALSLALINPLLL